MTNEPPSSFEPPRPIFSTWVGIVLLFALFALIALVIVAASPRGDHYEKTRAKARAEKLRTVTDETNKLLTTYAWVDKNKGRARIPINDAMRLTLAELAGKTPAPANPIAPAGAQAAAPATPPPAAPLAVPPPSAGATPKVTSVTGPDSENRGQPAAATNPAPVEPGTQPGGSATPAASPPAAAAQPGRPSVTPSPSAPGTPLPIRGKTP